MGMIHVPGHPDYSPEHLSYSTISTYRMCGKKWQLERPMKLEQRPGVAAIGGNAVHVASEAVDHLIWEHGFEALEPAPVAPLDSLNPSDAEPNF